MTGPNGGDVTVDWLAAGPYTYNHKTAQPIVPTFGYNNRTIDKNTGVVESLEGGDYECGDLVVFFSGLFVDTSTPAGASTIEAVTSFNRVTTGGGQIGFRELVSVSLRTTDGAYTGDKAEDFVGAPSVSETAQKMTVTTKISDLELGEGIIVQYVVRLVCGQAPGQVTGNIQTAFESAKIIAGGTGKVQVGQQVVPLKSANNIRTSASTTQLYQDLAPSGPDAGDRALGDTGRVTVEDAVYDTAQVSGLSSTAGGTITYKAYSVSAPVDPTSTTFSTGAVCTGTEVFSSGTLPVSGGVVPPSGLHTFTGDGTYEWQAEYSGDQFHTGSRSICGTETLVVEAPDVGVTKTGNGTITAGDTAEFTIVISAAGTGDAANVTLSDQLASGFSLASAVRTSDSADLSGSCTLSATQLLECNFGTLANGDSITVVVSGTSVLDDCAAGIENTATVDADVNVVSTNDSDSDTVTVECPAQLGTLQTLKVLPNDSATLEDVASNAGGNITFKLYKGECTEANLVWASDPVTVSGPGTYSTSNTTDFLDVSAGGTWNWVVAYSGDGNNQGATSGCGEESFTISVTNDPIVQAQPLLTPNNGSIEEVA